MPYHHLCREKQNEACTLHTVIFVENALGPNAYKNLWTLEQPMSQIGKKLYTIFF